MFETVLVANRGEIAVRAMRTLKRMGIRAIAVYSDADRNAAHVRMADAAVHIGGARAADSYLRADRILQAARQTGAQAIFPGYGFLSESADFAEACERDGVAFIGPTAAQIRAFGLKHRARELAAEAGVPMTPGSGLLADVAQAQEQAARIGFPVMLKSTAGGGGIGLSRCDDAASLAAAFTAVRDAGQAFFADGGAFVERYVEHARHIEVQIFGDGQGRVAALGERDCSIQRRNQKIIEETPAPGLPAAVRQALHKAAVELGESVAYRSAGTVEFIYDPAREAFYFLEVNTRLQVEHPVTEAVTGLDLIECMLRVAAGDALDWQALDRPPEGAAIEARLYAEDPVRQFQPSPGVLTEVVFPEDVRVDGWIETGTDVPSFYDPLMAKVIVHGKDRAQALERLADALARTRLHGIATNLPFLRAIAADKAFGQGGVSTSFLQTFDFHPRAIEVLDGGTYTTIQDFPGRMGYWHIGVPPSGPMDDYAFRLANRIVGNAADAAGVECTLSGPTLRFHAPALIALTGATAQATLDGQAVPMWEPIAVQAGQVLRIERAQSGCRTYLAVRGGIDVPQYLGSRSTFVLGQFGGHAGRCLRAGDLLALGGNDDVAVAASGVAVTSDAVAMGNALAAATTDGMATADTPAAGQALPAPSALDPALIPQYGQDWDIGVLYGPHGAPDFFTQEAITAFLAADWEVHYNSNRLGVRLIGPTPQWARQDGGEAGLHPSNIHDCEYAVGSINFTGDSPVILTRDGPSLGGFVCPVTIVAAELWKVGQVRPGDRIRFRLLTVEQAGALAERQDADIATLGASSLAQRTGDATVAALPGASPLAGEDIAPARPGAGPLPASLSSAAPSDSGPSAAAPSVQTPILADLPPQAQRPRIVYRQAGDDYLLLEYGENVLDLALRMRVHLLMQNLQADPLPAIQELSPGVRSLQVRYDKRVTPQSALVQQLLQRELALPDVATLSVPTRVLRLPMAFEDSATLAAVDRYRETVRPQAPWLPNNVDFIQRINGLEDRDDVRRIVFDASYLVMGLGDVYLGAPCAVPIDPRHRLLTSKYNPARTFTAEGTVGIGGVYMCIYGMDSPGGYQLVGRTLPIWNTYMRNPAFEGGKPWLLRFFDQVRFYPVSEEELTGMREAFREGTLTIDIQEEQFDFAAHQAFLQEQQDSIRAFAERQAVAFADEVSRWRDDALPAVHDAPDPGQAQQLELADDEQVVGADLRGNVWKVLVQPGDAVQAGQTLVIIEAMKMEVHVNAPCPGVVRQVVCAPGRAVDSADPLVVIGTDVPCGLAA